MSRGELSFESPDVNVCAMSEEGVSNCSAYLIAVDSFTSFVVDVDDAEDVSENAAQNELAMSANLHSSSFAF